MDVMNARKTINAFGTVEFSPGLPFIVFSFPFISKY